MVPGWLIEALSKIAAAVVLGLAVYAIIHLMGFVA
jgi:hypothetical protein